MQCSAVAVFFVVFLAFSCFAEEQDESMKSTRKPAACNMRKYYQLSLVLICLTSVVTLLIYRHEYYRLRYVLEVLNFFGKPGVSEIEFCGPGFNATLLSEILRNTSMEVRESPPLFQEIDEGFYSYSSFLRSYEKQKSGPSHVINTIVIGKAHLRPNIRCNIWLENSEKPKAGRFDYSLSKRGKDFNLFIFHCSLSRDLGKPMGVSFYLNDYNTNPIHAPINRVIQIDTKRRPRQPSAIKFVNNVVPAICVVPNQVPFVSRDSFIQFLVFHHIMGVDQFTIYDSMISEDIIRRLNLLPSDITRWKIQFFPLNYPFLFSKSYEIVRRAVELDCLFRHFRFDQEDSDRASHAAVLSWDQYLVPRVHNNLKAVLEDLNPNEISFKVEPLLFCLNQADDDGDDTEGHPDIMRKTHYYLHLMNLTAVYIRNIGKIVFEDIFEPKNPSKEISLSLLGAHKYTVCRDPKNYHSSMGYNETQMEMFQHKFEGAMLKFDQSLLTNKVYRLYTSGQIWEKTPKQVRDML